MNVGTNYAENSGPMSYVTGKTVVAQIVLSVVIALIAYITFMTFEILYKSITAVNKTHVAVLSYTVSAEDKPREFNQDPSGRDPVLLSLSDNERTGAEFTYSFFLWINPNSFKEHDGLLHIFHKGHPVPFPLMGPGVFLKSNENKLRVYMNSSKTWNNYIDVENIPVKKWVHICIIARENAVEVYVNGNIAKKLNMEGGTLYQNFGNLYLFSQRNLVLQGSTVPSIGSGNNLTIKGSYSGNLSNLYYFSYALSYTEIQSVIAEGPSSKTESTSEDTPPYLADNWWVGQ
jgi:hypothetical protein